jgi:hypothetical protein
MPDERLMAVHIMVRDLSELKGLELDIECMPLRRGADGILEIKGIAPERTVAKLQTMAAQGVRIQATPAEIPEEASLEKLVSDTNRYSKDTLPRGVGKRRK